jgi:hypothetical protein
MNESPYFTFFIGVLSTEPTEIVSAVGAANMWASTIFFDLAFAFGASVDVSFRYPITVLVRLIL